MENPVYNHATVEKKWQKFWEENNTFFTDVWDFSKPKYYVLDMFPYPSGVGLHAGHPEGYTATDIMSRMKRMQGYNVLHPMGYDSFGLPAEQYAVDTGNHPNGFTLRTSKPSPVSSRSWALTTTGPSALPPPIPSSTSGRSGSSKSCGKPAMPSALKCRSTGAKHWARCWPTMK